MNIHQAAAILGSKGGRAGTGASKQRSSELARKASLIGHRDRGLSDIGRINIRCDMLPLGCWNWTSTINPKGYGIIYVRGKKWFAHRFSWVTFRGPIPEGKMVCHHCDNPKCVNPEHLFIGTNRENMLDAVHKGRRVGPKPWRTNTCKLTVQQVEEIRKSSDLHRVIAARFGITKAHVSDIKCGRCWR